MAHDKIALCPIAESTSRLPRDIVCPSKSVACATNGSVMLCGVRCTACMSCVVLESKITDICRRFDSLYYANRIMQLMNIEVWTSASDGTYFLEI